MWKIDAELETTTAVLDVSSEVTMVPVVMAPVEELIGSLVGLRVPCVLVNVDNSAGVDTMSEMVGDCVDVEFKTEDEEDETVCKSNVAVPLVREGFNAETLEELLDPDAVLEGALSVEEATSLVVLMMNEADVELRCVKVEMIEEVGPVGRTLLSELRAELPCPPAEEVVLN